MRTLLVRLGCDHEREIEQPSVVLAVRVNGLLWCLTCDEARDFTIVGELAEDTRPFQLNGVRRSGDGNADD